MEATNPVDYIYALLGLVSSWPLHRAPLSPDYSLSPCEVYSQTAVLVLETKKLTTRTFLRPATLPKTLVDLASWVPDWSAHWPDIDVMEYGFWDKVEQKVLYNVSPDGQHLLTISGSGYGCIQTLETPFNAFQTPNEDLVGSAEAIYKWLRSLYSFNPDISALPNSGKGLNQDMFVVMALSLCSRIVRDAYLAHLSPNPNIITGDIENPVSGLRIQRQEIMEALYTALRTAFNMKAYGKEPKIAPFLHARFKSAVKEHHLENTIIQTDNGYIGLTRDTVRKGDLLVQFDIDLGIHFINLIHKTSYRGVLKAYDTRLETAEPPFLTHDENEVKVHFREWDDKKQPDSERFLYGQSSTKPLKITPRMLKRLFSYHQVMPAMIDFLSVFAQPPQKREIGFSGFFDQVTLSQRNTGANVAGAPQHVTANSKQHITVRANAPHGPAVSILGRSGRQYQMCYNLKRVARTRGNAKSAIDDQNWSIQQNEFHHQFDVAEGTALWISAKGRVEDYRDEVLSLTGGINGDKPEDLSFDTREACFASSLTVHLMNCHWASQDWRGYVKYLEDAIERKVSYAVSMLATSTLTSLKTRHILVGDWISDEYGPKSLQDVQFFEEKATNAAMVLDANIEVMTSLRDFYTKLFDHAGFDMRDQCSEAVQSFIQQISDMMFTFTGYKRRMNLLTDVTENRKILVRIAGKIRIEMNADQTKLLQKLQSHATKKMEDLTTMSYRETIVMKVITVGTFVYLPATFVSTFFSTDIVKYQNSPDGKAMYSGLALERWLEITVPLTVMTVIMGLIAFIIADRRRKRRMPSSHDEKKGA
ncbi:hypothetical protein SLS60_003669 [Paraconiothyrium brasiliense]|uniref:CorA-like transporter domain-containing protein n=1 Tax=Paraconiothyrium brasiliense TaxID=300254 RepID=A0ABR3RQS7_9PLEO